MELLLGLDSFEDQIELNLPSVKLDSQNLAPAWLPYNPRKEIKRFGISLTSLDGNLSGIPDLDSLVEYNEKNGTAYNEMSFNQRTRFSDSFEFIFQNFDVGRSHLVQLGATGYFPFHRDIDPRVFRLIYASSGCHHTNLVWIINGKTVRLEDGKWYYLNTKKSHAVFSFEGSEFAVFNIQNNEKNLRSLIRYFEIK